MLLVVEGYMYVNGEWVDSVTGERFESINPANGEVLATFPKGNEVDVARAVKAAKEAFYKWRRVPPPIRAEVLYEAARIMKEKKEELARLISMEMGKVIAEARGEVQEGIDMTIYIAGEGRRLLGETVVCEFPDKFAMTVRLPLGVVAAITPWNFPVAIPCWKIMPAILCGNTVVFKPSSDTPLVAAKLIEILEEAGVPKGVVNMVTGPGPVVGKALARHPDVAHISFTGSVEVGREVYVEGAKRLCRVCLELGGKNPEIILEDADLDLAIEGAIFGAFGTAGQRCTATSRLIVHEAVYDEVLDRLLKRVSQLKLGDPLDPSTDMGPVVNERQMKRILNYIEIGVKEGARLLMGGRRATGNGLERGFFVEPTVFEAVQGMTITREEIFGPVLAVIKVRSFDEAIRVANAVDYGLSSSIYTRDINKAFKAIELLEAGITYINAPTIGSEVQLPFGGVKNTGNGWREAGTTAIEEYTEVKTVYVDYAGRLRKAQIERPTVAWYFEHA